MNRFNFLPAGFVRLDARTIVDTIPNRLRVPVIIFCATLLVLTALVVIDQANLRTIQIETDGLTARRDRTQVAVHRIALIRTHVLAAEQLLANVTAIRRRDLDGANELATIANALPMRSWIASLHSDGLRWTIDGETRDAQTVGATLVALRRATMLRAPTLVSFRNSGPTRPMNYQLNVERQP